MCSSQGRAYYMRLIVLIFLPAIVFLWFIGWSLYWLGELREDRPKWFFWSIESTAHFEVFRLPGELHSFIHRHRFWGEPIYVISDKYSPSLHVSRTPILITNIYILVKMYSRYTRTVLVCYYLIIIVDVFLLIRNLMYMTLLLMILWLVVKGEMRLT